MRSFAEPGHHETINGAERNPGHIPSELGRSVPEHLSGLEIGTDFE